MRISLFDIMTYGTVEIGESSYLLSVASTKRDAQGTGSSWWSSAVILSNVVLGIGLLNFPAAYKDAGGIAAALLTQTVCVICIILGLLSIAHCTDLSAKNSYQDVVHYYGGNVGLVVCNAFIFIHNFGTCVTFLVMIADQIDRALSVVYGITFCQQWFMNRSFTLSLCSAIFILPACFSKRIDSFTFGSFVGILTTFYIIGLVVWKYFQQVETVSVQTWPNQWEDIIKVVPTICFSFEGHIEAVPLYACMAKRNIREFAKVAFTSTLICILIYNSVGIFGYLGNGILVKSDILMSYYPVDAVIIVAMTFAALKAITSYPIVFFCARMVCENILKVKFNSDKALEGNNVKNGLTVVMFLATLLCALYVPTMGSVIALLGGSAAFFIFIFPGMCVMQQYVKPKTSKECCLLSFGIIFVVLGTLVTATTTVQSVQRYLNGEFTLFDVACSTEK